MLHSTTQPPGIPRRVVLYMLCVFSTPGLGVLGELGALYRFLSAPGQRAGDLGDQLARERQIDVHATLLELVDQECPPELAARILEPV